MRVLFDECVPAPLANDLIGHEVFTVEDAGLKGLKNGALLTAASEKYDVLITVDRGYEHQQNVSALPLAVLLLYTRTNKLEHLQELIPETLQELESISRFEFRVLEK